MTTLAWTPDPGPIDEHALLARTDAMTFDGWLPFDGRSVAMLGALSRTILADPRARNNPPYVALGYWLRPAALKRLVASFGPDQAGIFRVSRGVALHLPPTNVDTIFVYSWAVSVLAGNCNVVRLAQESDDDTRWLCGVIAKVVADHGQAGRHLFCTYAYGGDFEAALCAKMDLRMIWGGDAKVRAAGAVPIRPDGLSIGFPDRDSFAIIAAEAYAGAGDEERNRLAEGFFADVYWFDQMGCGSPRILFWVGDASNVSNDFYRRLLVVIDARQLRATMSVAIAKLGRGMDALASGDATQLRHWSNELDVVELSRPVRSDTTGQGGGFLGQVTLHSADEIVPYVSRKTQTIAHYGLRPNELRELAKAIATRGGYRLVPIGDALKFSPDWDGVRLVDHMTRVITIGGA